MQRRTFIRVLATAGAGTVAGCAGSRGASPAPGSSSTSPTPVPSSPTSAGTLTATAAVPPSVDLGFPIPVVSVLNAPVFPGLERTVKPPPTIDTELYRSSTNLVSGLLGEEIDMGYVSLLSLVNAQNEGVPVVGIAGNFTELPFPVVAGPDVDAWEDLRGKRIAVNATVSITAAAVRTMVREELGSADAVTLVQIPPNPSRIAALESGQVAAIAVALNGALSVENRGIGRILAQPWEYDALQDVLNAVWIVSKRALDEHPSTYRALVGALHRGARWCYDHSPAGVVDAAVATGRLSTEYDRQVRIDTVRRLQGMEFWATGDESSRRQLESFVDVLVTSGMLEPSARPSFEELIDGRFRDP